MDGNDTFRSRPPRLRSDWALFLDVDGCLLDHASSPAQVEVPQRLGERLCEIGSELDGAIALVSGRSIVALDELFPDCSGLCAAGLHGLERRMPGARVDAPAPPQALNQLIDEARKLLRDYPGACVEASGPCLNLHWRGAPGASGALGEFALLALAALPGYRLHPGVHGVEIRPFGFDKGQAITDFMAHPPFLGRKPVFAGDDLADECGFAVVNARSGISVLVGDRDDSVARHRLADPSRVRVWLGMREAA
ncbi:trehalose-phosphatase [Montanilutibacter psychrotolerans]|uniref:Trehalose 6-phosphate phosphatase n=1 Tax=Montanilutibacter psychrotolerans TaxID=1327343 RepID=A0A3M8SVP1_9GAMM|nr:trehalose-phosphatase [Lysobacter psychrotolerans]RNF83304.1 trehalose-phosphatase [Lysobacter psychrotolerans]